jgi:hypothetical protein
VFGNDFNTLKFPHPSANIRRRQVLGRREKVRAVFTNLGVSEGQKFKMPTTNRDAIV